VAVVSEAVVDRSPARTSRLLSLVAASVAVGAAALASSTGALVAVGGALLVAVGLVLGSRRFVTGGSFVALLGVLYGGLFAAPPAFLVLGTAAVVLAWDVGEQAINVGEQLGREADTERLELMHAAGSTVVAASASGVGYGVYLLGAGGQPVTALVFLLVAAVALTSALRR
jgi:hypothetical protein